MDTSLPGYQMLHLASVVGRTMTGPVCLWMDTLCIPVSKTTWHVRKAAIARMASIYQSASYTLILDKHLQQMNNCPYEMGLHVLCSELFVSGPCKKPSCQILKAVCLLQGLDRTLQPGLQ